MRGKDNDGARIQRGPIPQLLGANMGGILRMHRPMHGTYRVGREYVHGASAMPHDRDQQP